MMAFWLILSGHYDVFHITVGAIAVVLVLWFNYKMIRYKFFEEGKTFRFYWIQLVYFVPFMIWAITLSALKIVNVLIKPKMPVKLAIIKFKSKLPNTVAKVFFGNCITLTPGTLTVQIKDNEYLIHTLANETDLLQIDRSLANALGKLYGLKANEVVYDEEVIYSLDKL